MDTYFAAPPAVQRYGPPVGPPAAPSAPTRLRSAPAWVKVVAVVLATLVSLPLAAGTAFIALITYTGCFIGCQPEGADPLGGLALVGLSALLCAAGPLLAAALFRSRAWLIAGGCVVGTEVVLGSVLLAYG